MNSSCQLIVIPDHQYPHSSLEQKCLDALRSPDELRRSSSVPIGWNCLSELDCGCKIKTRMQEKSLDEEIRLHQPGALMIFVTPCTVHQSLFE